MTRYRRATEPQLREAPTLAVALAVLEASRMKLAFAFVAVLASACGSYLEIDASLTVPAAARTAIAYPAVLMFDYADAELPATETGHADLPFAGQVAAVLCGAGPDLTVQSKLYAAPANDLATPVIAWIAPKPAAVTEPCGAVPVDAQRYADVAFDAALPHAHDIANPDGTGKRVQRTVSIELVLAPSI